MEESTKDEQLREALGVVLKNLSNEDPDFYYRPTMQVANRIIEYVKTSNELSSLNKELLEDVTPEQIQYLLSFHHSNQGKA